MIHIKKWIAMLVLAITLVPTISNAKSYVAYDGTVISAQYHDYFNNYFTGKSSYLYFPYECEAGSSSRTCYYGIDKKGNYINLNYVRSGSSYELSIEKGIDNSFSVSGNNVIKKDVSYNYTIIFILSFQFLFAVMFFLLKVWQK